MVIAPAYMQVIETLKNPTKLTQKSNYQAAHSLYSS